MYLSTLYAAVIKVIVMGLLKHVQSLLLCQLTASSLMHSYLFMPLCICPLCMQQLLK